MSDLIKPAISFLPKLKKMGVIVVASKMWKLVRVSASVSNCRKINME